MKHLHSKRISYTLIGAVGVQVCVAGMTLCHYNSQPKIYHEERTITIQDYHDQMFYGAITTPYYIPQSEGIDPKINFVGAPSGGSVGLTSAMQFPTSLVS